MSFPPREPPERMARRSLVDPAVAIRDFTEYVFASSHGAFEGHLGAGLLYYSLGALVRSQVSVCIGSGGGFVPSLMRRAQLDAGIDPSVTYLVDANLPDLAFGSPIQTGGWMTEESAFLKREGDIRILAMLSVDAARLFAAEGVRIDHLHIDGDHSARGVLGDFRAYRTVLSDHAVITLHDMRMPGVREAVAEITRQHPDIEILSFPEIGAGTGVMRRRVPPETPRLSLTAADFVDLRRKTELRPEIVSAATGTSQEKARFERWSYLESPAYRLRYTLAASFIDEADATVVEIGGFPNSIVGVLNAAKTVHLVEPYMPGAFAAEVEALAANRAIDVFIHRGSLSDVALAPTALGPYNLVFLGLDLSSGAQTDAQWAEDFETLLGFVLHASRAVLEVPGYALSMLTFEHLIRILQPKVIGDLTLDLSRDPVADSFHVKDGRAMRRLVVIEPGEPVDLAGAGVQALIGEASAAIAAARAKTSEPVRSAYELGTTIHFNLDGQSQLYTREGWVGAEKRHRWMSDEESRLVLSVSPPPEAQIARGTVRLEMTAAPFVVPGKVEHQSLIVRVNGETVFDERIKRAGTIAIAMPASLFFGEHPVRLVLRHPDAVRPCDVVEGSHDLKFLSFAVQAMRLTLEVD